MGYITHLKNSSNQSYAYSKMLNKREKRHYLLSENLMVFICLKVVFKFELPLIKDALCRLWLKLAQWFWRRISINFFNVFSLFRYFLPLEKGVARNLYQLESPSLKDALC